jgi:hypothetical protein
MASLRHSVARPHGPPGDSGTPRPTPARAGHTLSRWGNAGFFCKLDVACLVQTQMIHARQPCARPKHPAPRRIASISAIDTSSPPHSPIFPTPLSPHRLRHTNSTTPPRHPYHATPRHSYHTTTTSPIPRHHVTPPTSPHHPRHPRANRSFSIVPPPSSTNVIYSHHGQPS